MTKYVNFKFYKRGVPNTDRSSKAKYRTCLNCDTRAYWTAISRSGSLRLEVRLCEDHNLVARAINERRKAS